MDGGWGGTVSFSWVDLNLNWLCECVWLSSISLVDSWWPCFFMGRFLPASRHGPTRGHFSHTSHLYRISGFSPVCVLEWLVSSNFCAKHFSHTSHLYGFSTSCTVPIWCLRLLEWAIPSCNLRQWEGPRLSHISYFFLKLMALSAKNLTKVSIFCFCNFEKCTFCFSIAKILQKVYRDFTWFSQFLIFKCTLDLLCDVLCDIHYDHTFMIYRYDLHYDLYCMDHWIALWLNKVVHFTSF